MKSISQYLRKKKKLNKVVLLEKVSISKALINSNISYDEFVLLNYVRKEYDNVKEEIKNLKT